MEILVYIVAMIFMVFYRFYYKKFINAFTIIIMPYVAILFLNNRIATHYFFKPISSSVQFMILLGEIFFFLGSVFVLYILSTKQVKTYSYGDVEWNIQPETSKGKIIIKRTLPYVGLVLLIRITQIIMILRQYGFQGAISNDFELFILRGPIGHLIISIFPLMMIYFYHWYTHKNKAKIYLFLYGIFFILAFIETEKAQVISLIIATFLYCAIKNKKLFLKGLIFLLILIAVLFMGNYVIKLTLQGYAEAIGGEYYYYRLWNYIAGGLINSSYIVGIAQTDAFEYLADILLAFPNLFINVLFDETLGPNVSESLPVIGSFPYTTTITTGFEAQTGNVVSTMSIMYGDGNIFAFAVVVILWGIISECIFAVMERSHSDTNIMTCCCYMAFSMVSFFASYYTLASFTERLIWCWVISWIFTGRVRFGKYSENPSINTEQRGIKK